MDSNILLRHFASDHPEHSPRASAYIERIERGEVRVRIAETVVFETVFTLERRYRLPKATIRDAVGSLLLLPGIVLPGKRGIQRALELYVQYNIPFGDAFHAMVMEREGLTEIVTFDLDFNRLPGITRSEP